MYETEPIKIKEYNINATHGKDFFSLFIVQKHLFKCDANMQSCFLAHTQTLFRKPCLM